MVRFINDNVGYTARADVGPTIRCKLQYRTAINDVRALELVKLP